jgi:hypothetical protein
VRRDDQAVQRLGLGADRPPQTDRSRAHRQQQRQAELEADADVAHHRDPDHEGQDDGELDQRDDVETEQHEDGRGSAQHGVPPRDTAGRTGRRWEDTDLDLRPATPFRLLRYG